MRDFNSFLQVRMILLTANVIYVHLLPLPVLDRAITEKENYRCFLRVLTRFLYHAYEEHICSAQDVLFLIPINRRNTRRKKNTVKGW